MPLACAVSVHCKLLGVSTLYHQFLTSSHLICSAATEGVSLAGELVPEAVPAALTSSNREPEADGGAYADGRKF